MKIKQAKTSNNLKLHQKELDKEQTKFIERKNDKDQKRNKSNRG